MLFAPRARLRSKAIGNRSNLKASLDYLWREAIRKQGCCQRCAGRHGLEAAHIIGRANLRTRWLVDNGKLLCTVCHGWAHAHPDAFREWLERKSPGLYVRLEAYANAPHAPYLEAELEAFLTALPALP